MRARERCNIQSFLIPQLLIKGDMTLRFRPKKIRLHQLDVEYDYKQAGLLNPHEKIRAFEILSAALGHSRLVRTRDV